MALSMFLRAPACTSLSQQVMRLATQQALASRSVASTLAVNGKTNEIRSTPILDSVRSFGTTSVRLAEKAHDHSKLWVMEKATSAAMIPLIPLALAMPNKITDSLLAILIVAHSFWGLEAVVVEYVRVLLFGEIIPKIAMAIVYLWNAVLLGGLFYLIFNDVGMANAFWKIWYAMRAKEPPPPPPDPGLEAIAVDYVRASIFGPVIPKIAIALVYLISIATLGGLFYIISHDVGFANAIRQLWAIKSEHA